MNAQILTALIAAGVSLILAVYNIWSGKQRDGRMAQLEERKAELGSIATAERARIDYEYDARRRIYEQCAPAMFQIIELAEGALDCIAALTEPETWVELSKGEANPPTAVRPTLPRPKYEALATLHGLYAPMAVGRLLGRKLSLVDLSLEPMVELQYHLVTSINCTFKDDHRLASIEPAIPYTPFATGWRQRRESEPRQYWWQGLTAGRLDGMLELMTVRDEGQQLRVMSFGEFERFYESLFDDRDETRRKTVAAAVNPIFRFRPLDRPVYWRMLISQARLYQALTRSRQHTQTIPKTEIEWQDYLRLDNQAAFDWKGAETGAPLIESLAVTDKYLEHAVIDTWLRRKS